MLELLIQAALMERAKLWKFPRAPDRESAIAWIKQVEKGRCNNGNSE